MSIWYHLLLESIRYDMNTERDMSTCTKPLPLSRPQASLTLHFFLFPPFFLPPPCGDVTGLLTLGGLDTFPPLGGGVTGLITLGALDFGV